MVSRGDVWWYEHPDVGRRPYNIALVRPALCTSRITHLGAQRMCEVCEALGRATAC